MSSREIVSLQIGHYSNFVGTHWWNIQESSFLYSPSKAQQKEKEVDHDVLWREGSTLKNEVTFTPRLVAVDLKGSLNTLKQEGILYETNQQEDIKWRGDITLHQSSPATKNAYLSELEKEEQALSGEKGKMTDSLEVKDDEDMKETSSRSGKEEQHWDSHVVFGKPFHILDDAVKVWSDYLRVHLHPKTIQIIEEYHHLNTLHPFDIYGAGLKAAEDFETKMALEDKIHYFCEECDNLQGFHVLVDTHDGFGGVGAQILQHIADEYSSKSVMTFGFTPSSLPDDTPVKRANRILNSALSYQKCFSQSSLFFPLSLANSLWKTLGDFAEFPHLDYKLLDYHTSAILAATLDTASLPYRTVNPIHLCDITNNFQTLGKKIGSLSTTLPIHIDTESNFLDMVQDCGDRRPWLSLTPHCTNLSTPFMQSVVVRGLPERTPKSAGSILKSPCHVGMPFPHIFRKNVNKSGFISTTERPRFQGVDTVPVMTSMQSSPDTAQLLSTLYTEAKKLNIRKHTRYLETGLEEDEYQEILQDIADLQKCYLPKCDMG
ncbi:protein misato homolog 1-like isoform X2 [Crassostrea virginica]